MGEVGRGGGGKKCTHPLKKRRKKDVKGARTHMKGVLALANNGRAVLAWELARGAHVFIRQPTNPARVLGVLSYTPSPARYKARTSNGHLYGRLLFWHARRSRVQVLQVCTGLHL